jgi:YidC/Oxa1 family membrane protein insertase
MKVVWILFRKKIKMPTNMIDNLRIALYAVLIVLVLFLFQAWNKDHPQPVTTTTESVTSPTNNYIPQVSNTSQTQTTPVSTEVTKPAAPEVNAIHVKTDVFDVVIDPTGGDITQVSLVKFPESLHSANPFVLLNNNPDTRYIAQSGLLSGTGPDTSKGQGLYTAEKTDYTLSNDQNELQVKLHWQDAEGLKVTKIFTFKRDNYEIGVAYQIDNQTSKSWDGNFYMQLMRKNNPPTSTQGLANFATYFGAAVSSPEKPYQKISFKEMASNNLNQTITGGWAAMIQHYFVSAWVPDKNTTSQYFSRKTRDGMYAVGMIGSKINVNPGQSVTTQSKFYAGPSVATQLEKVAPGLQLTIDYGWLWIISIAIFWMMQHIYNLVGNWGWSIVLVTLVIKLMFYHLSAKSYRSMSMLKKLQPKINQLKERFGEDKQKFTQATLELYRKEKVNPMSGCLPILIQIPVFIGLYWVLIESVQLRQAPWILWIHDLSLKDPYYILPVLMGFSMFLQQRLNPPSQDPMQAKVMMLMPVIFTVMFLNFPAGLMLYWFVNNTLSFLQQWWIMRSINKPETAKGKK